MSEKRFEWKVGLFVFIGLILVAALMLNFSKGLSLFKPTYQLQMKTSTVGGIKKDATVMMSGILVGKVIGADLTPDGKSVLIRLEIYKKHKIWSDAQFSIDALGFLGDQFVAIRPQKNEGHILKNGEVVAGQEPFDFQEVARASLGFIHRVDETAQKLNQAITRVTEIVLNAETLTNLSETLGNFKKVSEHSLATVDGIDHLFQTNSSSLHSAVSNLVEFSQQLNQLADELSATVLTNRISLNRAMTNLESASVTVKNLVEEVETGNGLAHGLIKDEELMNNLSILSSNLALTSSNLNRSGLWGILWKQKPPKNQPRPPNFDSGKK